MNKTCVVSSLSEYIASIEDNNLFDYISRGESMLYENPMTSGARRRELKKYSDLLEQYHLDVETSINHTQDKNFLAFAQHHGMPTNLLDFSFSPLVSLYFSLDGCASEGYVYFINKSRLININRTLYEKGLGWGMLGDLLNFDKTLYQNILVQMCDAFMANREEMIEYFENHAERLINSFREGKSQQFLDSLKGGVDEFEEALLKFKRNKIKWLRDEKNKEDVTLQIYSSFSELARGMQKIYKGDILYPEQFFEKFNLVNNMSMLGAERAANIYLMVFLFEMEKILYCYEKIGLKKKSVFELEFPFYFTHQPPIIDERVKNQSSIFIFQPFTIGEFFLQNEPVQIWQKIIPDYTIKILNPEKIRKELDAIGYNLKHIYCDYDSIAKYIVKSAL